MKKLLATIAAATVVAWGLAALLAGMPEGTQPLWLVRQQALYLTGLLAIAFLSLAMLASARPAWLARIAGSPGQLHLAHRWAGILGTGLALSHWLVQKSGGLVRALIGRDGRPPSEKIAGLPEALRHLAKDAGEWTLWLVLAMVVITLWRVLPHQRWRLLHRAMPLLYAMLIIHALLLAPRSWWQQGSILFLMALASCGAYGAACSLKARLSASRPASVLRSYHTHSVR